MLLSYFLKTNLNLPLGISHSTVSLVCTSIAVLITVRFQSKQPICLKINTIFHVLNLLPVTTLLTAFAFFTLPPPQSLSDCLIQLTLRLLLIAIFIHYQNTCYMVHGPWQPNSKTCQQECNYYQRTTKQRMESAVSCQKMLENPCYCHVTTAIHLLGTH